MPKRARLTKAETRERTRAQLLGAAGELSFTEGLSAISLDQIAEHAGLTKGAVYSNFESKEDLFLAVLDASTSTTVDLSMFSDPDLDDDERAKRFAKALADEKRDPRATAMELEFATYAIRSDRARPVFSERMRSFVAELAQEIEDADGAPSPITATDLVVLIDALANGLYLRRALNPELVPDELFRKAIVAIGNGVDAMNLPPQKPGKR